MLKRNDYLYLFFLLATLLTTTIAHADYLNGSKKRIIIFGDSLVDIGNLPPLLFLTPSNTPGLVIPPPTRYDRGRFSNGPNIIDYLSRKLHVHVKPSSTGFEVTDSVSFAHGGSTTYMNNITPGGFPVPGVLGQVAEFLNSNPEMQIDPRTIVMILSGSNDYVLGLIQSNGIPPINPPVTVQNMKSSINKLYNRGARRFVVFNLPDLGKIPICENFNICSLLSNLTTEHNILFTDAIKDLKREHNNIFIAKVNLFKILGKIVESPDKHGFIGNWQNNGPAAGCLFQDPSQFNPINCSLLDTFSTKSIFWDELHPATGVHKLIAKRTWKAIRRKLF